MPAASVPPARLIAILGLPGALQLVQRYGGGCVYLPHPSRLREGNKIAAVLGMNAARALCAEWPQTNVMLPRLAAHLRRARDRAILENVEGLSVTQLAWKYLTTERHVYRLRERGLDGADLTPAADRSQLPLF